MWEKSNNSCQSLSVLKNGQTFFPQFSGFGHFDPSLPHSIEQHSWVPQGVNLSVFGWNIGPQYVGLDNLKKYLVHLWFDHFSF